MKVKLKLFSWIPNCVTDNNFKYLSELFDQYTGASSWNEDAIDQFSQRKSLIYSVQRPLFQRTLTIHVPWTCHREVHLSSDKFTFLQVQIQCRAINYLRDYPRIDPGRFDIVIQSLRLLLIRSLRDKVRSNWRGMMVIFCYLLVLLSWIWSENDKERGNNDWEIIESFVKEILYELGFVIG